MRTMRRLFTGILALAILTAAVLSAFAAESGVRYVGGAEKFVFLPGSEYADTDLFPDLKRVLPGDRLEQTIIIRNESPERETVRLYLRSEQVDEEEMAQLLERLTITVRNGDTVLYQGAANGGMEENILLGTFSYGDSAELTVTLEVPLELDNRFMDRAGTVVWVFTAEKWNGGASDKPQTGDTSQLTGYVMLGTGAAVVLGTLLLCSKRRKTGTE